MTSTRNLSEVTVVTLKSMCKARGIPGYSYANKSGLIDLLKNDALTPEVIGRKNIDDRPFLCVNYKGRDILICKTDDDFVNITAVSKQFGKT